MVMVYSEGDAEESFNSQQRDVGKFFRDPDAGDHLDATAGGIKSGHILGHSHSLASH